MFFLKKHLTDVKELLTYTILLPVSPRVCTREGHTLFECEGAGSESLSQREREEDARVSVTLQEPSAQAVT